MLRAQISLTAIAILFLMFGSISRAQNPAGMSFKCTYSDLVETEVINPTVQVDYGVWTLIDVEDWLEKPVSKVVTWIKGRAGTHLAAPVDQGKLGMGIPVSK